MCECYRRASRPAATGCVCDWQVSRKIQISQQWYLHIQSKVCSNWRDDELLLVIRKDAKIVQQMQEMVRDLVVYNQINKLEKNMVYLLYPVLPLARTNWSISNICNISDTETLLLCVADVNRQMSIESWFSGNSWSAYNMWKGLLLELTKVRGIRYVWKKSQEWRNFTFDSKLLYVKIYTAVYVRW